MATPHRALIALGLCFSLVLSAAPVRAAAPGNDSYLTPTEILSAPAAVAVDLTDATLDGDPPYCGSGSASVWYRYTAASDELVTITLAGEPSMAAIHLAVADPLSLHSCLFAGWAGGVPLEAGQSLYLQVSTDGSPTSFDLAAIGLIANDRFAGADDITTFPATVAPDLTRSTGTGDPSNCASSGNGAWYRLAFPEDTAVDITPSSDAYVTLAGSSAFEVIDCLYPWNGRYRTTLSGGSTYHLLVQSPSPSPSGTPVTIDLVPPPPANDDRAAAEVITTLPAEITANLRSATPDNDSSQCFPSDWPSVWYRYTPSRDEVVDVEPFGGSGQAAALILFEGEEGETMRCTNGGDGRALIRAGRPVDIALGTAPSADPSVGMRVSSTPAPTIDVTVKSSGSVELVSGTAVISGTAVCSSTGEAGIYLQLRQRVGRKTLIEGAGHVAFACGPSPSAWTARIPGDGAPFGSGAVAVTFEASFGEWPLSGTDSGTATVKLRGN